METILRGIILGLSITAPIGPTNVELIRRGSREGARAAVAFWLGVIVALVLYLLAVAFGLSFLTESRAFNLGMTAFGVLVLAWLAWNSLRDFFRGGDEISDPGAAPGGRSHFGQGIVLTISNPAVLVLWTGILGADLAANRASAAEGFLLVLGILAGVVTFFIALTILIHFGRRFLNRRYLRYVSLVAGLVLFFFCFQFAFKLLKELGL